MPFCNRCGEAYQEGECFCPKCGSSVSKETPTEVKSQEKPTSGLKEEKKQIKPPHNTNRSVMLVLIGLIIVIGIYLVASSLLTPVPLCPEVEVPHEEFVCAGLWKGGGIEIKGDASPGFYGWEGEVKETEQGACRGYNSLQHLDYGTAYGMWSITNHEDIDLTIPCNIIIKKISRLEEPIGPYDEKIAKSITIKVDAKTTLEIVESIPIPPCYDGMYLECESVENLPECNVIDYRTETQCP